jgi:alkanesulfonate monooxygenase SsuD/methylene tetrahydromethanopterin reductase-like flavin-dependent oxidoreductase (luciferase family)
MEFGLFCGGFVPKSAYASDPDAEHTRILDEVRTAQVADRTNWKYWWTTEHHFLEEYSHISANEVLLAHVAAATEYIHVGSGIYNITPPVNHPARVAERVAMADHLSNGRFEFGTGRGSSTTEQAGFGITDPDLTKEMYDEVIGEFAKMWSDDEYSHDGTYFSMPPRNVLPKPWVKPHPPMWVAAGNPGTFEKAARMGLGVLCFSAGSPAQLAPLIDIYKNTIGEAEPLLKEVTEFTSTDSFRRSV